MPTGPTFLPRKKEVPLGSGLGAINFVETRSGFPVPWQGRDSHRLRSHPPPSRSPHTLTHSPTNLSRSDSLASRGQRGTWGRINFLFSPFSRRRMGALAVGAVAPQRSRPRVPTYVSSSERELIDRLWTSAGLETQLTVRAVRPFR